MTAVAITPELVSWWADLSGDYNPVHFEEADALRAGAAGVFAHGLLVLLAAQRDLAVRMPAVAARPITMRAHFREPVPVGVRVATTFEESGRFLVRDVEGDRAFISGICEPRATQPLVAASVETFDPATLSATLDEVAAALGASTPSWLGLQAACFARYVDSIDMSETDRLTILQTRHDVTLFEAVDRWRPDLGRPITFQRAPDEIIHISGAIHLTVRLAAFDEADPLMQLRLDILLRDTGEAGTPTPLDSDAVAGSAYRSVHTCSQPTAERKRQ